MPSDRLTSWLRTTIPTAWSAVVAWLVTLGTPQWVTEPLSGLGQTVLVPIALGAVYALLRWAEPRLPGWLRRLFFGVSTEPAYSTTARVDQ